jgi:hypothetical protein
MIKGAFIYAIGAGCGLAVGTVMGVILGVRVSGAVEKIAAAAEKSAADGKPVSVTVESAKLSDGAVL